MPQPTQFLLPRVAHHNQSLFSDYYLDHILPTQWSSLREEAAQVMLQLQQLYAGFTPNPNNEAQTEDDWMKPVLRILGHLSFEVQVPLKVPDGTQEPDYFFYHDDAARIANKGRVLTEQDLKQRAYAVGDAKKWERSLDQSVKGSNVFTNKNPSFQIFFYMLHSGLSWGILSNGRHWRLYHEQTAHKLEVFYEVDLPALLATNDVESFLYFYTFFRRNAFEPGQLSLAQILSASIDYARSVSEDLRQQVYDALRYVAQGFFDYPENRLTVTPETCKLIYDNSLTLLYRLLFILYAEARDLLPLHSNSTYQRVYSLHAIKVDIAADLQEGLLPMSGIVWSRLKALFHVINLGNPSLGVTTFNGGLFDPVRHEFLERYTVGDRNLCRALDKLARVKSQFVDYRDLAERHLGTIYEGLLEYTLQVAAELMVELKSSSRIVPAAGVPTKEWEREFQAGEVYLVTDRGERKTTGSYYTPDYIVKYMVDQSLRPILQEAVKNTESDAEKIQRVLAINVLDPSMGSGHFPVEVVEYIARFLVEEGVLPEEAGEADIAYWKRRVAQQCIYGIDVNPLAVELAKLSLWLATTAKDRPLSFLDHHLRVGNALIGSWLSELTANQHVATKQARAKKAANKEQDAVQLSLLSDDDFRQSTHSALRSMARIEHNPGMTLSDIKAQEQAYAELRQRFSEKYLRLANLGAAMYFMVEVDHKLWRPLTDYALGKSIVQASQLEQTFQQVSELATQKRFFHWELEFPDIFFDAQGQSMGERAGFDVVIGNPPYVRQEQLGADKPYFKERYEIYHGVADLFVYFFAQGLRLLRKDGTLAYISSNIWLYANYGTPLRQYLQAQTTIETLIDLGNNYIFADAPDLSPTIQIVYKTPPVKEYTAQAAVFSKGEQITEFKQQLGEKLFWLSIQDQSDTGWRLTNNISRTLLGKLLTKGLPLGKFVDGHMYRGVLTGLNKVFIINQAIRDRIVKDDPNCTSIIKPLLRGEDLRPWYQENEGQWLIFTRRGIDIEAYPAIKAYLQQFRNQLEPRPHNWNNDHIWDGRKPGPYKWYEIQDSIEYYEEFEKPKIFFPDITKKPRFSWGEEGTFVSNTGYCISVPSYDLLGLLSSRTLWYVMANISQPLGERSGVLIYRLFRQYMERLPIPTLTDTQRAAITTVAKQLTDIAQRRYQVRRKTAHRIQSDLSTPPTKLNQRLETWWELSFKEFREEIVKVFKRDIPLKDRDDWEDLLREGSAKIKQLTEEIVTLEIELNKAVYEVFELNDQEIKLIEQETKYHYGEW